MEEDFKPEKKGRGCGNCGRPGHRRSTCGQQFSKAELSASHDGEVPDHLKPTEYDDSEEE